MNFAGTYQLFPIEQNYTFCTVWVDLILFLFVHITSVFYLTANVQNHSRIQVIHLTNLNIQFS